jgi:hypothetical protein
MAWFLLESLVALLLAVGIVWWTMRPPKRRDGGPTVPPGPRDDVR